MSAITIPKRFMLFGQEIIVRFAPEEFTECESMGVHGLASYRKNEIQLRPSCGVLPLKKDQIEHTFWHELVHHIMYRAGSSLNTALENKTSLQNDEGFVFSVGQLLHQAVSTFEGNLLEDDEK